MADHGNNSRLLQQPNCSIEREGKQAKILLLHKAADTSSISRQTLAPHPLQKNVPYESVSFHTEKEFDHEFLRS